MSTINIKGYELQDRIGGGGFGVVHRAYQSTVGREVAIKVILPKFANQPDFIRRFETEAQVVARLEHPFIVPLFDYWRDPDGAYLVMRYLRGGSVSDAIRTSGAYDLDSAARLLDQITSALELAHRNGVIHRDLKPSNLLLDEDGNTYLADFGIAKSMLTGSGHMTGVDVIVGSPDYISPEQARQEPVAPQADIYNLGVILYEILTGEHPFPNLSPVERMYKHINDPLPKFENADLDADVVEAVDEVIQMATTKNPAHRTSDALAVATAFRHAIGMNGASVGKNVVEMLTFREQEILKLIVEGKSNKEIASELYITVGTVKWHIRQVYTKLHVRSRVQAIVRARELNLIIPDTDSFEPRPTAEMTFIPLPKPENPYKGLRAFQSADVRDFFGREKITQKLINRLGENDAMARFLAVVGPSGSGKSSLVKAGLIPALWKGELSDSEKWFVVEMMPGTHPFDKLEVALTRVAADQSANLNEQLRRDERGLLRTADLILPNDGSELVLVIDQFEEVFTLLEDEALRIEFLMLLQTAVMDKRSRVRVVVTLRADFYDRPLHYPEFGELVRNRMETILPLTAEELERAILKPAQRVGVTFEEGLVTTIVDEINYQAGALPLLQYALTELFEKREGRELTHAVYQDIGGTIGALAKRADDLYHEFDSAGKAAIHQLFLRLVTLGEGTEDTRRRVARSELLAITDDPDLMDDIIDTFADYRLFSLDHDPATRTPTVEVAHEAILREWERLRGWLNESRDDIKIQRQLATLAAAWKSNEHDESYLVRGSRLEQFQLWSLDTELSMTPTEMDFLSASTEAHERREAESVAQAAREKHLERRAYNRLRMVVAVLLVASAFGITLTIGIYLQRQSALKSRDDARVAQIDAEREAEVSQSVALAASAQEALLRNDTDLAIALALDANSIDNPPIQAWQALTDAVYAPGTRRVFSGHEGPVSSVAFSPDGQYIAAGGGRRLDYVFANGTRYDSPLVADYSVRVFDVETGEEIHRFAGHTDAVWYVKFSTDSNLLYSVSRDNTLRTWSIETGQQLNLVSNGYDSNVRQQRFGAISEDCRYAVVSWLNNRITVIDTETGEIVTDFDSNQSTTATIVSSGNQAVWKAAFSPSGQFVLVGAGDFGVHSHFGELSYWDVSNRRDVWRILLDGPVRAIAFDPTGNFALVATYEPAPATFGSFPATSILILIDVQTGNEIRTFRHGYGPITDLAFSPDGRLGVSVGSDQVIKVWDIESGEVIESLTGHEGWITDVDFSPNGRQIVTSSEDGTIRLWDIRHGAEYRRFAGHIAPVHDVTISPQGDLMVSSSLDRTLIEWNIDDETIYHLLRGHDNGGVLRAILIDEGRKLISSSPDGTIRFWDTSTGELLDDEIVVGIRILGLAISPDERYLVASISSEGGVTPHSNQLMVWDITTGTERYTIPTQNLLLIWRVAVTSDGRSIISVSGDGTVSQWDLATGQLIQRYDAHSGGISEVAISPDGSTALLSSEDRTIIVWDIQSGQEIRRFEGHSLEIYSVAISPDGKTALTGSADRTIILWDLETGEVLRRFNGHQQRVIVVRYSLDGQYGFSGGESGDVVMWRLFDTTASVMAWSEENRYIRDLTCEERSFYNTFAQCSIDGKVPTRAIFPTLTPNIIPSPTPTLNLTQTTATPTWTPLPSITPPPSITPAPTSTPFTQGDLVPNILARSNLGSLGSIHTWTFSGSLGQSVILSYNAINLLITIVDPSGNVLTETENTRIGPLILPETGIYQVVVQAGSMNQGGGYTLTLTID